MRSPVLSKLSTSPIYQGSANFLKHYIGGLVDRAESHHIFLTSGGLAFSLLICIIPFVLILFSVLGNILEMPSIERQIRAFIDTAVPYKDTSSLIERFVFARIAEFTFVKSFAGYLGAIGLLFAASGLFSSMRTILNSTFGFAKEKSALIGKLLDLGMVFLAVLFVLSATTLLPLVEILRGLVGIEFLDADPLLHEYVLSAVSFLIIFFIMYFIYHFVPYIRLNHKVALVSAVCFTILWEIAKRIFGYYVAHFGTLTMIYGAYVFLITGIFWIYYSAFLFIFAAEIGQLYRERLDRNKERRPLEHKT